MRRPGNNGCHSSKQHLSTSVSLDGRAALTHIVQSAGQGLNRSLVTPGRCPTSSLGCGTVLDQCVPWLGSVVAGEP
ncbi:hypothetical protein PoB_001497200 [Plakobranchus ocellatus]|uniref:Uncharacterized protein n=1 Tax=Plakobranchus ocellatus TaxID=259542 RepID=A0AAV3Z1R1_9GAST|nr:hypothetical protein PoB_001497200 [Plakobranchus ocellatus]